MTRDVQAKLPFEVTDKEFEEGLVKAAVRCNPKLSGWLSHD